MIGDELRFNENQAILFIRESTLLSINALLVSTNHSVRRICAQISWDQVDHDVSFCHGSLGCFGSNVAYGVDKQIDDT